MVKENAFNKTIHFDSSQMARAIYGNTDENLIVIEHDYGVELTARDLILKIKGKRDNVEKAFALFEALRDFVRTGRALNKYELHNIMDSLSDAGGRQDEGAADFKIAVPSRRRYVFPKTPNQRKYVEAITGNDIVFGIGPAGTGKCVAGDTLVLSDRGLVPIAQLAGEQAPDSYAPIALTVAGMHGPESASHIYYGGKSATKKIRTRFGFEIETTHEHPLLRMDRDGKARWVRAEELNVGDHVAIQRGQRLFGSETAVRFSYEFNSRFDHSKQIRVETLDTDLAYLMGLLTGDGCLTAKNRVILSSADPEVVEHFKAFAGKHGLHVFRNGGDRPYDWIIGSSQLYQLLFHLGMSNALAHEKAVPSSILRAPREIVVAYLQGLFDSDGTVQKRDGYPQLHSMSKQLIVQAQLLLLNFDILCVQRSKRVLYKNEERICHYIEIAGAEADKFYEAIGFRLARKQNLRFFRTRNANVDVVPYVSQLIDIAISAGTFSRGVHKRLGDYKNGRRSPGYGAMSEICCLLENIPSTDASDLLMDHMTHKFFWAEIQEIKDGESEVYDLTVPGSHSFCANGFVNHNTYLAMAMAVSALHQNKVGRIILVRPAVEAGESLGFLPGDMLEKVNPYLRPLYDALYDMMDVDKIQRYMDRGLIEVAPLAFMRGRTLNDSFIIMDEAQNSTMEQMKMFLTRLGYDSKAVITGDVTQVDLPINKGSGLVHAQEVLRGIPGIKFFHFSDKDVVRHELVKKIIRAYERRGGKTGHSPAGNV